ncbi:LacI family transcriptional regulator [Clostridium botulinum]|uniref:Transcriptional regulator, LacI family n=1 Tax=Clostridium botulinum (strain Eklund 17B / Type B) TaxID=935198 RepID=B2TMA2_CLOBB|nr:MULTISPECIES: LacI family DNA-binding transcriptional regulator [unclassified Clostridium]ACD23028.1 transcriptional regulator, LacI family [Clostridium botulinum B str. Eklund 17B (NRP)]MBN1038764.1 LacI family transcriptional regulator [Clostridium botulinum]MBY6977021.1 LacI family DNA-binding transcriptional regulator [Clostridium botulinum]MBY6999178.1 LacI family DNA-binding transcriptional regulator [Clostridium botulinum]MCR1272740.1 LacI family transcriptional regulator [Clostridiu
MTNRKVTLKDIAKEANVSPATVSYVLNYSEKEKISHETRLKVFEAARKLNYVPNMTARSLASQKSYLIGVIINLSEKNRKSKIYGQYNLVKEIQKKLYSIGYDLIFLPTKELQKDIQISQKRCLDAVFIIDMPSDQLKEIVNHFYVPVIFIDSYLDDPIFNKVLTDYEAIFNMLSEQLEKEFYVVIEDYSNDELLKIVRKKVLEKNIFINKFDNDLIEFLHRNQNKKGIIFGEILGMQAEKIVDNRNLVVVINSENDTMLLPDTKRIIVSDKEKAKKAVEIMEKLIYLENDKDIEKTSYIKPIEY